MPNFQVSLRDSNNEVALSQVGSTIKIDDYSNYIASDEVGHTQQWFEYIYIGVQKLTETEPYVYSSISPYDSPTYAPVDYTASPNVNYHTYDESEVYKVTLISLPAWADGEGYSYLNGHTVIYGRKIYKSKSNLNTYTPTNTTYWDLVADLDSADYISDLDNIASKYRTVEYIAIACSLYQCSADMVYTVNCIEMNVDCNDVKLCDNNTYRKAMRLSMILDSIQTLMNDEEYNKCSQIINEGKLICSCCNE